MGESEPPPVRRTKAPEEPLPSGPIPELQMPESSLAPARESLFSPDDLAEHLFDLSSDLVGMRPNGACRAALGLVLKFVPVEAASILRRKGADKNLMFVAVSGPIARDIIGEEIAAGEGLAGLSLDMDVLVVLSDAQADSRHSARIDETFGFRTRSILCVPISNDSGVFGVMQLVNPPDAFQDSDLEAAQTIAKALASALSGV